MKSLVLALAVALTAPALSAQIVQLPTVQGCNVGKASGSAQVYLSRRDDINTSGTIDITATNVGCTPQSTNPFPTGDITMRFSLTDNTAIADMKVTLIEQMTFTGKHTPIVWMSGRCTANGGTVPCKFWLMLADNAVPDTTDTPPDQLAVIVFDKVGNRLAYGAGSIKSGDLVVEAF